MFSWTSQHNVCNQVRVRVRVWFYATNVLPNLLVISYSCHVLIMLSSHRSIVLPLQRQTGRSSSVVRSYHSVPGNVYLLNVPVVSGEEEFLESGLDPLTQLWEKVERSSR